MAQGLRDIIILRNEEVTRGVESAIKPQVHHPFQGDGLSPVLTNNLAEILSSHAWPYRFAQVPLGSTVALTFNPDVNIATIRDLILLTTKRTAGNQESVTIKHDRAGVGIMSYLGCVIAQLSLQYSRSGSPDGSALLSATVNFECMQPIAAGTVSAGTQGSGAKFNIGRSVFTINGVQSLDVLSYSRSITIDHDMIAPDSVNKRSFIEDGALDEEITIIARFSQAAWSALVLGGTELATTSIVHDTGGTTETVTETIGKAQISTHELARDGGMITEQIVIKPFHTGSADPTVWTFGAGVGASALGI